MTTTAANNKDFSEITLNKRFDSCEINYWQT